jgi:UDP-GlcNAc:undecaprenyl-phosphate GlcNAc-1-phosphate transferase
MPIFALSYPLLDTGMSILRRWLRGAPLSRADSRHIHHQLRSVGLGPGRAVAVIYVQAAIAAGLGLFVTFMPPAITVAIAGAGAAMLMFIMLYGVRRLNYHEFVVAQASVVSVLRNARTVVQDKINARDIAAWIGAASTIGEVEAIVANSASIFRFAHIAVTYEWSPPHVSASFAADQSRRIDFWTLQYPIAHEDSPVSVPLFLSISCSTGAARRPAGAERVAQILAPAIATWIGTKAELPTKSDVPVSVDWTPAIGPLPVDGSWPSFGNRRPREHSALAD